MWILRWGDYPGLSKGLGMGDTEPRAGAPGPPGRGRGWARGEERREGGRARRGRSWRKAGAWQLSKGESGRSPRGVDLPSVRRFL